MSGSTLPGGQGRRRATPDGTGPTVERATLDDSEGHMGSVLERLQDLHRAACVSARPDPVKLAGRLFERETSSGYDVFRGAVVRYADILGKDGVAEYRRLAHERWSKVPTAGPGQKEPEHYTARSRISSIMMALARMDGDVEAQVEVLKKDLSHPCLPQDRPGPRGRRSERSRARVGGEGPRGVRRPQRPSATGVRRRGIPPPEAAR
jgi:hypothetical protein